jgi:hypothetical protein
MKIIFKNLNALYTKISFDLSKVFKECSLIEYMKQNNGDMICV